MNRNILGVKVCYLVVAADLPHFVFPVSTGLWNRGALCSQQSAASKVEYNPSKVQPSQKLTILQVLQLGATEILLC